MARNGTVPIKVGNLTGRIDEALGAALLKGGTFQIGGIQGTVSCGVCKNSLLLTFDYNGYPEVGQIICANCFTEYQIHEAEIVDKKVSAKMTVIAGGSNA